MSIKLVTEDFDHHQNEDIRLWNSMIDGDEKSFEALYKKYVDKLYRFGFMIVSDRNQVEDAIHDVFTSIWSNRTNMSTVLYVRRYLFSCLKHKILKELKKEKNFFNPFQDIMEHSFVISPDFLQEQLDEEDKEELSVKLKGFLLQLSARQREILYLRFYQNLSYAEIATLLSLDQKYIYNTASTAFKKLRVIFKEQTQIAMALLPLHFLISNICQNDNNLI